MSKEISKRGTTELAEAGGGVPHLISSAGEDAVARFVEFFTANIRNKNTRRAYLRNSLTFLRWCEKRGIKDLKLVKPVIVAAYIEQLQETLSKPSVKQQLATIRMLFDWLVVGQVVPVNPASSVRGPKHSGKKGKTPILSAEETRQLLDSIDVTHVVGLRDRAIIAAMVYSFARVGAMLVMKVEDYTVADPVLPSVEYDGWCSLRPRSHREQRRS